MCIFARTYVCVCTFPIEVLINMGTVPFTSGSTGAHLHADTYTWRAHTHKAHAHTRMAHKHTHAHTTRTRSHMGWSAREELSRSTRKVKR